MCYPALEILSGFMHITHCNSHAGGSFQLFCRISHGRGILKIWQTWLFSMDLGANPSTRSLSKWGSCRGSAQPLSKQIHPATFQWRKKLQHSICWAPFYFQHGNLKKKTCIITSLVKGNCKTICTVMEMGHHSCCFWILRIRASQEFFSKTGSHCKRPVPLTWNISEEHTGFSKFPTKHRQGSN